MARRIKQTHDLDLDEEYNRTNKAFPSPKYVSYNELIVGKIYYAASIFDHESFVIHEKHDSYCEIQYVDDDGMCVSEMTKLPKHDYRNVRFGKGIIPGLRGRGGRL